jgi:repressor of nif and glnA expression
MSLKVLGEKEAVELVISILKEAGKPLTTREIEEEARKRMVSCPDKTPVFLNKLRIKGIVEGQLSAERRGWIWWIKREG